MIHSSIIKKVLGKLFFLMSFLVNVFFKLMLWLFFILVFSPISLILRFLGYDPLRIKKNKSQTYIEYKKGNSKINFEKLF